MKKGIRKKNSQQTPAATPEMCAAIKHLQDPDHLQVAGGRRVVDLDVGAVGRRKRQAVPEPQNRGAGVGFHLAADVGRVPLPRVDHHRAQNLGSVCSRMSRGEPL